MFSGVRLGRVPLPGASGVQRAEGDVHWNPRDPGGSTRNTHRHYIGLFFNQPVELKPHRLGLLVRMEAVD